MSKEYIPIVYKETFDNKQFLEYDKCFANNLSLKVSSNSESVIADFVSKAQKEGFELIKAYRIHIPFIFDKFYCEMTYKK